VKIFTAGRSRVRYPDLVVTCARLRMDDREIPEPRLIVEVLSESSTAIDRGVKRAEYAALPSVRTYIMLPQDLPAALVCDRAGGFEETLVSGTLVLDDLGVTVDLAELYQGIM
jgi:Uma2 family endonuclease